MNNLMIFEGNNVEVFEFEGKVLFNPRHVGKCLELGDSAIRMAIKEMNEKQVIKLKNSDVNSIDIRKLNNAGENFLTESGVYKLIFKSRKENAEKFQDWVTDEVLPTIRKTGGYISNTDLMVNTYFGALDESHKGLVKSLFQNIENQQKQIIEKDKEITYLKPKATYCDEILKSVDTVTITQIAKDYGMSAIKLNSLLNDMKIQFKSSGQWLLYSKYHGKGYTKSETAEYDGRTGNKHTKVYTKWTQKGRMFLYEKLKENNILPLIEVA